jgi:SAM-dependent methyltransferase
MLDCRRATPSNGVSLVAGMSGYYDRKLAASSLERVYELAPPRVQQYLRAEVDFAVGRLGPTAVVLDLGCGYGRTLPDLARAAAFVVAIDTSESSLALARARLSGLTNVLLARMDASRLAFADGSFDAVVCIQNGISAFHVDQRLVVCEALRVLRPGGVAMFSSYSDQFWEHRLAWFEAQAAAGLIGEIDPERTGEGVIVCTDGLTLTTVRPAEFATLVAGLDPRWETIEVDGSSRFYVLQKPGQSGVG